MLRCKNLFFFLSLFLSVFFFFFPIPPYVLSPTQWSEVHREQSSEKFRGAERLFSGAAIPAALHTIRAREKKKNHKRASHRAFLRRVVSNDGRGEEGGGGGATAAISVYLSEETQSRPE